MVLKKSTLNTFQRSVLLWNDSSPYNAVHVVRIPFSFDLEKLKTVVDAYFFENGLTSFHLDRQNHRFSYDGSPASPPIHVLEEKTFTAEALRNQIENELNTPFSEEAPIRPFRFFVLRETGGFYLGLTYFHLVSGADSIIHILKYITARYSGAVVSSLPLELYPREREKVLCANFSQFLGWLKDFPARASRVRGAYRHRRHSEGEGCGYLYLKIGRDEWASFRTRTQAWKVTMNDLFLAAILKSFSPAAAERHRLPKRKNLSVACIVNTRKDAGLEDPRHFGLFLSAFFVSHEVPEEMTFEALARDVYRQTQESKKQKRHLLFNIDQRLAQVLHPFYQGKHRQNFYSKHHPLSAGLTNVYLDPIWPANERPAGFDYFRAVSTSPAYPAVFSLTTVDGDLNVSLSYRRCFFDEKQARALLLRFREEVCR